jgi:hypothetical protein
MLTLPAHILMAVVASRPAPGLSRSSPFFVRLPRIILFIRHYPG